MALVTKTKTSIAVSSLFFFTSILAPTTGVAEAGGAGPGGGDPFTVDAVVFPDKQKLDDAIVLINSKIAESRLPAHLKVAVTIEARELREHGLYRYLESIIVLPGSAPEGYQAPQDANRFLALGAMTATHAGAAVYFSKRALVHEPKRFAALLLHELLHHVLSEGLRQNESFVELLSQDVISGAVSDADAKAINRKFYPTAEFVSSRELFDLFDDVVGIETLCRASNRKIIFGVFGRGQKRICETGAYRESVKKEFLASLPLNIAEMTTYDVRQAMAQVLNNAISDSYAGPILVQNFLVYIKNPNFQGSIFYRNVQHDGKTSHVPVKIREIF